MDEREVDDWFAEYLSAYAALGRGDSQPADLVKYYEIPMRLTTDDLDISLGSGDEVAAWLQSQADAMRTANYDHTEGVASEMEVLNRKTALHRAEFSRQRADGTEINHMFVTYIITRGADGFRISALLLHSP